MALPLQTGMGSERSPSLPRMLRKKSGIPRPKTIIMDTLWVSLVKRKLGKSLKKRPCASTVDKRRLLELTGHNAFLDFIGELLYVYRGAEQARTAVSRGGAPPKHMATEHTPLISPSSCKKCTQQLLNNLLNNYSTMYSTIYTTIHFC